MKQSLFLIVAITVGFDGVLATTDPCFSYTPLNDSTRLTSYTLKPGEDENSDAYLAAGWYRNVHRSDGDLMTTCPNQTDCGTVFPVWINGTLPSKDKIDTLQACKHTFGECCGSSSTIQVKRCNGFYVYNLHPMAASTGRYCFRGSRKCTGSESSPTGYAPCSSSHLAFSVTPRISPRLTNDNPPVRNLAFTCSGVRTTYRHLQFDVVWEVEGTEVIRKTNLTYSSLLTNGKLTEKEWTVTGHKIGIHLRCGIRAQNGHSSTAFYYSEKFYAGFEIRQTQITVNSGDSTSISIRSTVPIACPSIFPRCKLYIEMVSLSEQLPPNTHCNRNITNSHNHSQCGILFDGSRWSQYHAMTVDAPADQQYRPQYTAILKLRISENNYVPLWNNFVLPDIKVIITDPGATSKKGRVCKFITDPHLKPFDGSSYYGYSFGSIGEFILYKNKEKPYSVQTITSDRYDYGNCAVGVQAGADIFIIYGCEYPGKWVFKRYCSGDTQRLDVYEKDNGRNYEVHLPSGTYINILISPIYHHSHYLDVEIHISPSEWEKTDGLCGTFNGNQYDDRIDRTGKILSNNEQIAKAWSVSPAESLFIEHSRTAKLEKSYYFCSCNKIVGQHFHSSATCSWRDGLSLCPPLNWNEQECSYRRKRDLDEFIDDAVIDAPLSLVAYQPSPPNLDEWKNGWNRTSATEYCTRIITGSSAYAACKRHTTTDESASISICVSDIQITGHTKFSAGAVESFKSACSNEVRLNTSLWTPTTQSQKSPAEEIMDVQCPNDCKQDQVPRGTCVQGICQCFRQYTGPDCSTDKHASPVLFPPTSSNVCDQSKSSCRGVSLYGSNFDHNSEMKCKIQVMKTTKDGGATSVDTESTVTGIQRSFGEVICPLGNLRHRRSGGSPVSRYTQLLVSVSNNANNYSSPVPVVIFDSTCMACTMPGGRIVCKQRNDICVTGDVCYSLSSDMCQDKKKNGDDDEDDDKGNNSKLWIIGAVLGGLALVVILGVVLFKLCIRPKMHVRDQYIGDSYNDLQMYSNPPAATHYKK